MATQTQPTPATPHTGDPERTPRPRPRAAATHPPRRFKEEVNWLAGQRATPAQLCSAARAGSRVVAVHDARARLVWPALRDALYERIGVLFRLLPFRGNAAPGGEWVLTFEYAQYPARDPREVWAALRREMGAGGAGALTLQFEVLPWGSKVHWACP